MSLRLSVEFRSSSGEPSGGGSVPVNLVAPAIIGAAQVGETLSCSDGTWSGSPSSYAKQWLLDDVEIGGETGDSYGVVIGDLGGIITCEVVATNVIGDSDLAVSDPTDAVTPLATLFMFTVDTTKTSAGSSASDAYKLPLANQGTLNFEVDWGDGSSDTITAYNQTEVTHTYASSGVYDIALDGVIAGWRQINTGDKLKITDVSQWGNLGVHTAAGQFYGCANMVVSATDELDVSAVTNMSTMFRDCAKANPRTTGWDTSHVTTLNQMFYGASMANPDVSGWSTGLVTNMQSAFILASVANPDVSGWDIGLVTDMTTMFLYANLSQTNYDALLIAWAVQSVQSGVVFSAGSAKYGAGAAAAARTVLAGTNSWTITDGGAA